MPMPLYFWTIRIGLWSPPSPTGTGVGGDANTHLMSNSLGNLVSHVPQCLACINCFGSKRKRRGPWGPRLAKKQNQVRTQNFKLNLA